MRRQTLRTSITAGIALTASSKVGRQALATTTLSILTDALRSTGSQICIRRAEALEALPTQAGNYDLHLRSAGLNAEQAQQIATAIRGVSAQSAMILRYFSMSFNPGVGDAGAIALAAALPTTVTEVGLVKCDIGDEGGEALLKWASRATALRMICVEDNRFSQVQRERYFALGREQAGLLVIV